MRQHSFCIVSNCDYPIGYFGTSCHASAPFDTGMIGDTHQFAKPLIVHTVLKAVEIVQLSMLRAVL